MDTRPDLFDPLEERRALEDTESKIAIAGHPLHAMLVTFPIALSAFLWVWHLPAAYTLAWNSHAVYWLMQAGMLGCGVVFWSHIFHAAKPSQHLASVGMLLALAGQMGLIGAILTFAPQPLYPQHVGITDSYGLSALADQQLAGLVMWVPGMLPLALIGGLLLRRSWRMASLS